MSVLNEQYKKDQRLISPVGLGILISVLVILLVLLFPSQSVYFNEKYMKEPDALSIAYLKILLQNNPESVYIRKALSSQLIAIGSHAQALEVFKPLLPKPSEKMDALSFNIYVTLRRHP